MAATAIPFVVQFLPPTRPTTIPRTPDSTTQHPTRALRLAFKPHDNFLQVWSQIQKAYDDAYSEHEREFTYFDRLQAPVGVDIPLKSTLSDLFTSDTPFSERVLFVVQSYVDRQSSIAVGSALVPVAYKRKHYSDLTPERQDAFKRRKLEERVYGTSVSSLDADTPLISRELAQNDLHVDEADNDNWREIDEDGFKIPSKVARGSLQGLRAADRARSENETRELQEVRGRQSLFVESPSHFPNTPSVHYGGNPALPYGVGPVQDATNTGNIDVLGHGSARMRSRPPRLSLTPTEDTHRRSAVLTPDSNERREESGGHGRPHHRVGAARTSISLHPRQISEPGPEIFEEQLEEDEDDVGEAYDTAATGKEAMVSESAHVRHSPSGGSPESRVQNSRPERRSLSHTTPFNVRSTAGNVAVSTTPNMENRSYSALHTVAGSQKRQKPAVNSKGPWTAAEDETLVTAIRQGLTVPQILERYKFDRSESSLRNRRRFLSGKYPDLFTLQIRNANPRTPLSRQAMPSATPSESSARKSLSSALDDITAVPKRRNDGAETPEVPRAHSGTRSPEFVNEQGRSRKPIARTYRRSNLTKDESSAAVTNTQRPRGGTSGLQPRAKAQDPQQTVLPFEIDKRKGRAVPAKATISEIDSEFSRQSSRKDRGRRDASDVREESDVEVEPEPVLIISDNTTESSDASLSSRNVEDDEAEGRGIVDGDKDEDEHEDDGEHENEAENANYSDDESESKSENGSEIESASANEIVTDDGTGAQIETQATLVVNNEPQDQDQDDLDDENEDGEGETDMERLQKEIDSQLQEQSVVEDFNFEPDEGQTMQDSGQSPIGTLAENSITPLAQERAAEHMANGSLDTPTGEAPALQPVEATLDSSSSATGKLRATKSSAARFRARQAKFLRDMQQRNSDDTALQVNDSSASQSTNGKTNAAAVVVKGQHPLQRDVTRRRTPPKQISAQGCPNAPPRSLMPSSQTRVEVEPWVPFEDRPRAPDGSIDAGRRGRPYRMQPDHPYVQSDNAIYAEAKRLAKPEWVHEMYEHIKMDNLSLIRMAAGDFEDLRRLREKDYRARQTRRNKMGLPPLPSYKGSTSGMEADSVPPADEDEGDGLEYAMMLKTPESKDHNKISSRQAKGLQARSARKRFGLAANDIERRPDDAHGAKAGKPSVTELHTDADDDSDSESVVDSESLPAVGSIKETEPMEALTQQSEREDDDDGVDVYDEATRLVCRKPHLNRRRSPVVRVSRRKSPPPQRIIPGTPDGTVGSDFGDETSSPDLPAWVEPDKAAAGMTRAEPKDPMTSADELLETTREDAGSPAYDRIARNARLEKDSQSMPPPALLPQHSSGLELLRQESISSEMTADTSTSSYGVRSDETNRSRRSLRRDQFRRRKDPPSAGLEGVFSDTIVAATPETKSPKQAPDDSMASMTWPPETQEIPNSFEQPVRLTDADTTNASREDLPLAPKPAKAAPRAGLGTMLKTWFGIEPQIPPPPKQYFERKVAQPVKIPFESDDEDSSSSEESD